MQALNFFNKEIKSLTDFDISASSFSTSSEEDEEMDDEEYEESEESEEDLSIYQDVYDDVPSGSSIKQDTIGLKTLIINQFFYRYIERWTIFPHNDK